MERLIEKQIVFFGTGPVAAASLRLLVQNFSVEAVITKPGQLHHHAKVPVVEAATQLNLPVVAVTNKEQVSTEVIPGRFQSRLAVLIDFGIIIEQQAINAFPLGIINSHFSLLPQWRGADPISFAVLSGQPETGVSLMLLVEAMDEGPLLATAEINLEADITTPKLTSRLIKLSDTLLKDTLPRYISGKLVINTQTEVAKRLGRTPSPTYSRKLTKKDGMLDWRKSAEQLDREVRAYLDWPKSHTVLNGHTVIITKAHVASHEGPAGGIWRNGKQFGIYTAKKDVLVIDGIKPAGKSEMSSEAFLNGYGKDLV